MIQLNCERSAFSIQMVDLETRTEQACTLRGGEYFTKMYADIDDAAPAEVMVGCTINFSEIFAEE